MLSVRFARPLERILRSPLVLRDNVQGRALTAAAYVSTTDMTVENCISFCNGQNYNYAGLEWYQECYCGNLIINGGAVTTSSDCSYPCTGDASEVCGAANRLSMYYSGQALPPAPVIVPSVGLWKSLGCYLLVVFRFTLVLPNLILSYQRQRWRQVTFQSGGGFQQHDRELYYGLLQRRLLLGWD